MSEWTEGAKVKSLEKIEKDLHSIDINLGRIANALEKLIAIQYIVDKEPDEEQHCPFQPSIICDDVNDLDECNSKCPYFGEFR